MISDSLLCVLALPQTEGAHDLEGQTYIDRISDIRQWPDRNLGHKDHSTSLGELSSDRLEVGANEI